MKVSIEYINCKDCKARFMIGLNKKSTSGLGSNGSFGQSPYIAIGANELDETHETPTHSNCPECGKLLKVESAT